MANLTHLLKVKQKVKYHDPDTGKWHNGEIKETHSDHVIVDIPDISDHCWFEEDLNLEYLYPEYNFEQESRWQYVVCFPFLETENKNKTELIGVIYVNEWKN